MLFRAAASRRLSEANGRPASTVKDDSGLSDTTANSDVQPPVDTALLNGIVQWFKSVGD
jgi:hypothetical protein